ncbi:hypothetical protein Y032_0573g152 [Ancylostoma ceylanicum]|uniref:Uncharacterized protein n=1 Tax=Ancylostoma ceylanicum TaxID=53326 RepID=A0A016WQK1_9BILA|nr:hypothetical protein Y032_0573g152 [Ancylostoma ceylanicum]
MGDEPDTTALRSDKRSEIQLTHEGRICCSFFSILCENFGKFLLVKKPDVIVWTTPLMSFGRLHSLSKTSTDCERVFKSSLLQKWDGTYSNLSLGAFSLRIPRLVPRRFCDHGIRTSFRNCTFRSRLHHPSTNLTETASLHFYPRIFKNSFIQKIG